jgi:hypothetical protein
MRHDSCLTRHTFQQENLPQKKKKKKEEERKQNNTIKENKTTKFKK